MDAGSWIERWWAWSVPATLQATLEIRGSEQLVRVLSRLERLPYVQAVRRVAR